ncbi:MAG: NAD(P)H-dependent oxidoreductase subunit E, partial [Nitrospinae bacterium]|nr:NAD(P)H-dependent oxidoreductase subunit E [Nitrospinota bacterium]
MVDVASTVTRACKKFGDDRGRLIDILREIQRQLGCIDDGAMELVAAAVKSSRVEVEGVVTFYSFFSREKKGEIIIRVCDDIIDRNAGSEDVAEAFAAELGISVGQTTPDGNFSLELTPCVGMSDQAPAALVNEVVITNLTAESARETARLLKKDMSPSKLVSKTGDGNNGHKLVNAMVKNNVRKKGDVLLADDVPADAGLRNALKMSPQDVIREITDAGLRGRGGAGFPTGEKFRLAAKTEADRRYVICNADEGEPGTFKDRVLLTERADLLFEGMTIAARAIGSDGGVMYLRAEYEYLLPFLEETLDNRRKNNLLGSNILGKKGFDFDVRIQMGAGAYICGEESALISSCEGLRGEPKNRPPFPVEKGYLGKPTSVNNVETLCCVARILDRGAPWFSAMGTKASKGTKLLSVCGDCERPGIYEVP